MSRIIFEFRTLEELFLWTLMSKTKVLQEFEFIKHLEKETGAKAKKEDRPVTNSTFNTIREHESQIQDGKGGI